jgi:hypothetical protein
MTHSLILFITPETLLRNIQVSLQHNPLSPHHPAAFTALFAQQQIIPVFPPQLCKLGGSPQASRRTIGHKMCSLAALPVLPACKYGGSFRNFADFKDFCNLSLSTFAF